MFIVSFMVLFFLAVVRSRPTAVSWPKLLVLHNAEQIRLVDVSENQINYTVLMDRLYYCTTADAAVNENQSSVFFLNNKDELVLLPVDKPHESQILVRNINIAPQSLSVDWVTKKIYWSEERNGIEVLSYEKQPYLRKVLIYENLANVRALIVAPIYGYIFYNNNEDISTVERAWMDGTNRQTILQIENMQHVFLTVDYKQAKLYWTDPMAKEIYSANFDGSDRKIVAENLDQPYSLAIYDNYLFWNEAPKKEILWCNKNNCTERHPLISDTLAYALKVYATQPSMQNPCSINNGGCSHLCLLIPEKPFKSCACPTGIRLHADNATCLPGPSLILLVARRSDLRLISLDTPDYTDTILRVKNAKNAIAVDYDAVDGFVYWSDSDLKEIRRVRLNATGNYYDTLDEQTVIATEIEHCDGLAVDWIARNLYWTDSGTDRIEVARLDGVARRVLISTEINSPRAIVLDPLGGYMYWSDWNEESPKIEKALLDGSNRSVLVKFDNNSKHWPNGLALDGDRQHLYYADAKADEIWRVNVATGRQELVVNKELHHAFGLSILGNYIYWSDWTRRSVERANKANGSSRLVLHKDLPDLMGIKAVNLTYKPTGINDCAMKNGGCSHLCLFRPRPFGKICMCPVGFELSTDRRTCVVPEAFLVYTQNDVRDIMRISLSNFPSNLDRLQLHNVSKPLVIDYNYKQNKIYWAGTEGNTGVISSAYLNGSQMATLIDTGIFYVEGLAVDWCAENLYWSDSEYKQIEVSRLDGRSRRVVVWQDVYPRALVVHPGAGFLYWADWTRDRYTVQRSELSGSERTTFLSDVGRVVSLTIDYESQKLYYASNGDRNAIGYADLNGESRHVLVEETKMKPYAVTFFADQLYWADWDKGSVEVCNKLTGGNRSTLHANIPYIAGLMAVHPLKQKGWNVCATKQHKCEHLCFYSPSAAEKDKRDAAKCECPTHYTLENGRTCRAPVSYVLFSENSTIRRLKSKDGQNNEHPVIILPLKTFNVRSLHYDPYNASILWLTWTTNAKDERKFDYVLRRAKETNAIFTEYVVKFATIDAKMSFNIFYDPYSAVLFYTSETTNSINATRVHDDGSVRHFGAIIENVQFRPKILVVDGKRRSLFFANAGSSGSIVHCKLDGKNCKTLVDKDVGEIKSLAVDWRTGVLYWSDSNSGSVQKINADGRDRATVSVKGVVSPIAMTVYGDRLYFVDAKSKFVESIPKNGGGEIRKEFHQTLNGASTILSVDDEISSEIAKSPCRTPFSSCSHLCLLPDETDVVPSSVRCACPLELALDHVRIHCVSMKICKEFEFRCADGLQCIDRFKICDGVNDCVDASDELTDVCKTCPATTILCATNGTCVPRSKFCDQKPDCADGTDERCDCPSGYAVNCKETNVDNLQFYCIQNELRCNGVVDCKNGVDEDKRYCNFASTTGVKMTDAMANELMPYYVKITLGFLVGALFVVIAYLFYRRSCGRRKQHPGAVQVTVVNEPGCTVGEQNFTLCNGGNNVEMTSVPKTTRSTPRSIVGGSTFSQRPDLTGKSSSSSDAGGNNKYYDDSSGGDSGRRRAAYPPPPPSLASSYKRSAASSSAAERSSTRRKRRRSGSGARRKRTAGYGHHRVLYQDYYRDPTPPPPYSPCSTEVNHTADDQQSSASSSATIPRACDPLISPNPPPPSPVVSRNRKRRKTHAPPPSPVNQNSD